MECIRHIVRVDGSYMTYLSSACYKSHRKPENAPKLRPTTSASTVRLPHNSILSVDTRVGANTIQTVVNAPFVSPRRIVKMVINGTEIDE